MTHFKFDRDHAYVHDERQEPERMILPDDDPPPCDRCRLRAQCAAESIACRAFVRWVSSGREQRRGKTDLPNLVNMDRAMRL